MEARRRQEDVRRGLTHRQSADVSNVGVKHIRNGRNIGRTIRRHLGGALRKDLDAFKQTRVILGDLIVQEQLDCNLIDIT